MRQQRIVPALQKIAIYAILIVAVIASIIPLMWAFSSSLRPISETFSYTTPFQIEALLHDAVDARLAAG